MTTKTNAAPTYFVEVVPGPAVEARQRLASAESTLTRRRTELSAARRDLEALRGRLTSGDESVTTDELLAAEADVRRLETLTTAAEGAVKSATRALVNDDITCGLAVAEQVAQVLGPNLTVTPLAKPIDLPTEVNAMPPSWVLCSDVPQADHTWGTLVGKVKLARVRGEHHRPLVEYGRDLDAALRPFGVKVLQSGTAYPFRVNTTELGGGLIYERSEDLVVKTNSPTPVLNRVDVGVGYVSRRNLIAAALGEGAPGTAKVHNVAKLSEAVDSEGARTVSTIVDFVSWASDVLTETTRAKARADALVGTFVEGVGVVKAARVSAREDANTLVPLGDGNHLRRKAARIEMRLELVSAVAPGYVDETADDSDDVDLEPDSGWSSIPSGANLSGLG